MNKKILLLIVAFIMAISGVTAQKVMLSASPDPAAPGAVDVTVSMSDFTEDAAAVTLFIDIDANLLTLTGYQALDGAIGGTLLVNSGPNDEYVVISWTKHTGNDINMDFAGLTFSYKGGFDTELNFIGYCEIVDVNANIIASLNPDIGTFQGTTIHAENSPIAGIVKLGFDEVIAGEIAEVELSIQGFIDPGKDAAGVEFRIGFNPEQLLFMNAIDNILGLMVSVDEGMVTLSKNGLNPDNFASETVVAKLRFTYLGGGKADLEFLPGSFVANFMTEYLITGFEDGYIDKKPAPGGKLVIEKVVSPGATLMETPPPPVVIPAIEHVTVTASDFDDFPVGDMTLRIAYEGHPDMLQYLYYAPGTITGWSFSYEPGLLTFTKVDNSGFVPEGVILNLYFNYFFVPDGVNTGQVDITFRPGTLLQEPMLDFIPVDLEDGFITTCQPATVICPDDIIVQNDSGQCGAEIEFAATVYGMPEPEVIYLLNGNPISSPYIFDVGMHTVEVTVENFCGTDSCSFTVTVEDNEAPEFTIIPEDFIVECDGEGNPDELNEWLDNVDAIDNCGTVTITHDFTELSDGCGATGSAFVIWTAIDAYGNTTTTSATFTIEDTTAPEFTTTPEDLTVECDGLGNADELNAWLADVAATDNCGTVTITHDFTELTEGCGYTGTALVTWTATDECGNTTTTFATFTIEDTTAPIFTTVPEDLTVECDGEGNVSDLNDWLADVAADDVCGTVSITHDFTELSDGCGATGSALVIWTATDDCGNTTTTSATFTIEDTSEPTLVDPDETCASLNDTFDCPADLLGFDANSIAKDVAELYQDVCGAVSATLIYTDITDDDCNPVAVYTFKVEDECGNFVTCDVTYTIERQDFVMPEDDGSTIECADDLFEPVLPEVYDYCGVLIEDITGPELIGEIPECEGTVTLVYTYTDCAGFSHDWKYTFTIERSTPPYQVGTVTNSATIACAAEAIAPHLNIKNYFESFDNFVHSGSQYLPGSFEGDEGFEWIYNECRNQETFGIDGKGLMLRNGRDSYLESEPIPGGIGNFSVQMRKAFSGSTVRQLELWINNELIASSVEFGAFTGESDEVFDFIVDNINIPGEIVIMIKPAGNTGTQQQITIDNITWTSYSLPIVQDVCGGRVEDWTVSDPGGTYTDCDGTIVYTYTFTDCAGLDFNWDYTYTIERQDFEMPDDEGSTIECADDLFEPVLPEVYDYCGVLIEDITGPELIGEIPECEGTVTLVYTYTDCAGFSNDWKYTFIIERSTAPAQVGTVTKSATIACAAEAIAPHLNIKTYSESFDNFEHSGSAYSDGSFIGDNGVTWNYINARNNWMGDSQPYVIDGKGMILRNSESSIETTLNDGIGDFSVKMRKAYTGGNPRQLELYVNNNLIASSVVFGSGSGADPTVHEFIVENINIAGEVTIKLVSVGTGARQLTIDDISLDSYNLPIIQDICGSKLDWTDVSEISDYDGCTGTITYTYTYRDCADLEYLWSYTYYINDDQPPVLIGEIPEGESDMNLCFDQIPDGPSAAEIMELFEDNCGGTVTVTKSIDPAEGTDCSWVVTYTYTVADECGNATEVFVIYSGGDTEKPVWDQEMPVDDTVSCDQVPEIPEITASDICDEDVYVSFDETRDDGACAYNYTLTRTWEAEDNCGNRISHVQVITVLDTDAPVLVGTLPTGETGMNLCFSEIPKGPSVDDIAELFLDNCGEVVVTKTSEAVGDNCSWIVTYTYTISDECGNAADPVVIVYSGGDTEAPELVGTLPGEVGMMSCVIAIPEPTINKIAEQFIDNCGNVNVVKSDEQFIGDTCGWAVTYTYTVSDDCGNYYTDPVVVSFSGSYPLPLLKDEEVDCSSLNKLNLNWDVGYAEQFQPASLEEQVGDLYLDPCGGTVTATHIHTEKDHYNSSGPVQWNFYYTYRIVNSCGDFVDCTVHYSGSPTNVPPTITIDDKIVESGQEMCFGATETIEISNLIVEAGGIITLIAGESIKMLPGVVVMPGGYLHAYISDTYCENPTPLIVAKATEDTPSEISAEIPEEYALFNVYPNPTRGSFTLDVYDFDSDLTIEIYNMVGTRILSKEVSGFSKYTFDISTQPNGIYIIRVLKDNESAFRRIIKQ